MLHSESRRFGMMNDDASALLICFCRLAVTRHRVNDYLPLELPLKLLTNLV